ncbi:GNAT family N-acetyltransferase [Ekhidna sp.]|uniref:GNAT family N-acetyltransferase n=1 Tax=Ekhidna sp. TaxID=2608089 RepID=UPI003CCC0C34
MITIRKADRNDVPDIITLFENTVRSVNQKDYSAKQIDVWANAKNKDIWSENVKIQYFYLAEIDDQIVGFSSIDDTGYLDFMYVHKDFQRRGIAKALLEQIEQKASELRLLKIHSSVSITAQPFFKSRGFKTYDDEHKVLKDVAFINALMEKVLQ